MEGLALEILLNMKVIDNVTPWKNITGYSLYCFCFNESITARMSSDRIAILDERTGLEVWCKCNTIIFKRIVS